MNVELCDIISIVTATQKRPDVETAAKHSAKRTKLDRTEAALTARQIFFENAQAKLERQETDTLCSIISIQTVTETK